MNGWERNVRRVEPYVPGEQPKESNVIKLNTNENPYPPAPGVRAAIEAVEPDTYRLYPDPDATVLTEALADAYGVSPEQVFVGVGSDDVLAMCFLTFFNGEKPVLFPDITYSFYDVWTELFGIPYARVPLDDDFHIRAADYKKENGGIIFPNPNAPTGVEEPQEMIIEILEANPDSVVIIDEAYVDFGAKSVLPLIDTYENLLVVQTMSKSRSMAGARIGWAFGSAKLIGYLKDVKFSFNSYTMSRMALAAGTAALADRAYFDRTRSRIIETREQTKLALRALGFSFPDSKSNFIFATHASCPAKELFDALKEQRIYVRYFDKPRIDNYIRITVGTDAQMRTFLDFLKKYLNNRQNINMTRTGQEQI